MAKRNSKLKRSVVVALFVLGTIATAYAWDVTINYRYTVKWVTGATVENPVMNATSNAPEVAEVVSVANGVISIMTKDNGSADITIQASKDGSSDSKTITIIVTSDGVQYSPNPGEILRFVLN